MTKPTLITLDGGRGTIAERGSVRFVFSDGIGERGSHSWYSATIDQDRLFRLLFDAGVLKEETV